MIKAVTGVPGAGKTYFVMREISSKYFTFDDNLLQWVQKTDKKLTIFTNIKNFRLPAISIDEHLEINNIDYETFFTVPYFEKLVSDYGQIVCLIDEAQRYFPSDYRNKDVLYFFQYHRHLGVDIYLTFQSWVSISKKITDLLEFEIRAVRRSFAVLNEFRYKLYAGNETIGSKTIKTDKKIFALYQSFDQESLEKPPRPVRKLILVLALVCVSLVFAFSYFVKTFFSPPLPSPQIQAASKQTRGAHATPGPVKREAAPSRVSSLRAAAVDSVSRSVLVRLGGVWVNNYPIAIEFFGRLVPVEEFFYPYTLDSKSRSVNAYIPSDVLASVRPASTCDTFRSVPTLESIADSQQNRATVPAVPHPVL